MTRIENKKTDCSSSPLSFTSDCSSRSSTASNDLDQCVLDYLDQRMAAQVNWTDTMDENFLNSYIAFRESTEWDNKKSLEWNFNHLAAHLVENGIMVVTGPQLQSRFYYIKRKWDLFWHLRGMASNLETGIGWDADGYYFTATDDHWNSLVKNNSLYAEFVGGKSCFMYDRLSDVLIGKSATRSRAQSASQVVPPEPERQATTSRRRRPKNVASSSATATPPGCIPDGVDAAADDAPTVGGKSSAASRGTSGEAEGSRGTKASRSTTSALEDALSKIGHYSEVALERQRVSLEYDQVTTLCKCQDIIEEMDVPSQWKILATTYYASPDNEGERIVFIHSTPASQYDYLMNLMHKLGIV